MQTKTNKKLKRIETSLSNMGRLPKAIIKYGVRGSLALMTAGSLIILLNHYTGYNSFRNFVGISIIKNSITLLAEFIIGGLIIDFIFKKN